MYMTGEKIKWIVGRGMVENLGDIGKTEAICAENVDMIEDEVAALVDMVLWSCDKSIFESIPNKDNLKSEFIQQQIDHRYNELDSIRDREADIEKAIHSLKCARDVQLQIEYYREREEANSKDEKEGT